MRQMMGGFVLCGRPALDFTLDEQQHSLAGWAKQCIKEGRMGRIIDPCLRGQVSSDCLKEFGQIAYECILTRSKDRPTMTKVLARLEVVLTWTLQSAQRASDRKHIGRSVFIEKAWSMCLTKGAIRTTHGDGKAWRQGGGSWLSWKNKKKEMMMEKHATKLVEVGCHSGGVATASRQVVPLPPSGQTIISLLKVFNFSELQRATENFKQDRNIGEGAFGTVYKGWLDSGDGLAVAIKKSSPDSDQGCLYVKSDVYSFGVVMLELITGVKVLDAIRHSVNHNLVDCARLYVNNVKKLERVMDPRLEQDYPPKGASKAFDLMRHCLEQEPKNRPSMEEVASCLQGIDAIKMKPSQSKANTKRSSNCYH
ncbi:hypothetical protein L1987_79021 [Smallanthus sonchifolius]|uniref:Uncharacterized protein n=1 Tax=Smallanthus sonchifolius TaxID=185202 RepID=A0ACB8ZDH3_9ASTR|nr:hypothetical protein L1987_79021 [Smallanthus sonchifolius]